MLPALLVLGLGSALSSAAAAAAPAQQRAALYSSRALSAEDSARLATPDGLLSALRAAATRSPAAHLTIALVSEDVRGIDLCLLPMLLWPLHTLCSVLVRALP